MASREAVIRFLDKIARNEELNRELAHVPRKASAWVAVANRAGLEFTVEELRDVAEKVLEKPLAGDDFVCELLAPGTKELSDEQLVAVAGGASGASSLAVRPDLGSRLIRFNESMGEVHAYPYKS